MLTKNSEMSAHKGRLKKQYCDEIMAQAVGEIKSNSISAYAASKKYKIPVSTLRDRVKGLHNKTYGAEKVLSEEEESLLAEWVILCSRSGFPKSKKQILKTGGQLANLHPTKTFLRGTPTSGWFKKFAKRHPEVVKRKPESIGKASAAVTAEGLMNYFSMVQSQFEQIGKSHLLNKPESWWNVAETGFDMNPTPLNVYAEKGVKTVHIIERGKSKENITCTYAVSGYGKSLPPLITFKESFSNLDLAAYVSKGTLKHFQRLILHKFNCTFQMWERILDSTTPSLDG